MCRIGGFAAPCRPDNAKLQQYSSIDTAKLGQNFSSAPIAVINQRFSSARKEHLQPSAVTLGKILHHLGQRIRLDLISGRIAIVQDKLLYSVGLFTILRYV